MYWLKNVEVYMIFDYIKSSYYNYYTNKIWGDAKSYDLCINSGELGVGGTAKVIEDYIKLKNKIEKIKL